MERKETIKKEIWNFLEQDAPPESLWLRLQGVMAATVTILTWTQLHMYPLSNHLLANWSPLSQDYDLSF